MNILRRYRNGTPPPPGVTSVWFSVSRRDSNGGRVSSRGTEVITHLSRLTRNVCPYNRIRVKKNCLAIPPPPHVNFEVPIVNKIFENTVVRPKRNTSTNFAIIVTIEGNVIAFVGENSGRFGKKKKIHFHVVSYRIKVDWSAT